MAWRTVPICEMNWQAEEPGRTPVRMAGTLAEQCYRCGHPVRDDVIYVRRNVP
jgi:hypothetical protein